MALENRDDYKYVGANIMRHVDVTGRVLPVRNRRGIIRAEDLTYITEGTVERLKRQNDATILSEAAVYEFRTYANTLTRLIGYLYGDIVRNCYADNFTQNSGLHVHTLKRTYAYDPKKTDAVNKNWVQIERISAQRNSEEDISKRDAKIEEITKRRDERLDQAWKSFKTGSLHNWEETADREIIRAKDAMEKRIRELEEEESEREIEIINEWLSEDTKARNEYDAEVRRIEEDKRITDKETEIAKARERRDIRIDAAGIDSDGKILTARVGLSTAVLTAQYEYETLLRDKAAQDFDLAKKATAQLEEQEDGIIEDSCSQIRTSGAYNIPESTLYISSRVRAITDACSLKFFDSSFNAKYNVFRDEVGNDQFPYEGQGISEARTRLVNRHDAFLNKFAARSIPVLMRYYADLERLTNIRSSTIQGGVVLFASAFVEVNKSTPHGIPDEEPTEDRTDYKEDMPATYCRYYYSRSYWLDGDGKECSRESETYDEGFSAIILFGDRYDTNESVREIWADIIVRSEGEHDKYSDKDGGGSTHYTGYERCWHKKRTKFTFDGIHGEDQLKRVDAVADRRDEDVADLEAKRDAEIAVAKAELDAKLIDLDNELDEEKKANLKEYEEKAAAANEAFVKASAAIALDANTRARKDGKNARTIIAAAMREVQALQEKANEEKYKAQREQSDADREAQDRIEEEKAGARTEFYAIRSEITSSYGRLISDVRSAASRQINAILDEDEDIHRPDPDHRMRFKASIPYGDLVGLIPEPPEVAGEHEYSKHKSASVIGIENIEIVMKPRTLTGCDFSEWIPHGEPEE